MKTSNQFVVAALAGLMATTSLGGSAAYAAGTEATAPAQATDATATEATAEAQAPYATQEELLKTADEALATLTHVRAARLAIMDNDAEVAKAEITEATNVLTQGEVDLKALRVADTEKPDAEREYLPFDMSMTLADEYKPTEESETALKKAKDLMQSGDKDKAVDVLRGASVDINISAALLPEASSMESLKKASEQIDSKDYFDANLTLKSIEDSVIVRTFGLNAIPAQGANG